MLLNVRCVPTINDTLVSVDQLWDDSRVDAVFRDIRSVILSGEHTDGRIFPWTRESGLNIWHVVGNARDPAKPYARAERASIFSVHSIQSQSHVSSLPPETAASIFHRRFHAGIDRLRRMPTMTSDAPKSLERSKLSELSGCVEAAASHLPHSSDRYQPSYPGRLVHADIAGPFISTLHGSYQYVLVLIDDHSRFKAVYLMKPSPNKPNTYAIM